MLGQVIAREGEATPVDMLPSTLSNPFITREGEAPAEPWRCQLGRSLALPVNAYQRLALDMLSRKFIEQHVQLMTAV